MPPGPDAPRCRSPRTRPGQRPDPAAGREAPTARRPGVGPGYLRDPGQPVRPGLASRPQKQTAEQGVASRVLAGSAFPAGLGRAARAEAQGGGGAARDFEKPCEGKEASVTRATSQRAQNNRCAPSCPVPSGAHPGPAAAVQPLRCSASHRRRQPRQSPACRPGEEPQRTDRGPTPGHAEPGASRNAFAFDSAWLARANRSR